MNSEWHIQILESPGRFGRDIYIYCRTPNGTEFLQAGDTALTIAYGSAEVPRPTIHLQPEQLQALADELAHVGYKPEKGFIEGKLDATENHLADLRKMLKLK